MEERYRKMSHAEFEKHMESLSAKIEKFLTEQKLRVDYVVPILRSGAVPAVYIANKLNLVKFAPFQAKHVTFQDKREEIAVLFNPFETLKITKASPVFLVVDATHHSGRSAKICIDEIYKAYPGAKIIYAFIQKTYGGKLLENRAIFECYEYECGGSLSKEECKRLNIAPSYAIYPWENEDAEMTHPDDFEDNIYF